jgi:hypothetical protein
MAKHPRQSRLPSLRTLLPTLAALLATGCAPPGAAGGPEPGGGPEVRVENRSPMHLRVYLVRDGQEVRLGRVEGLREASFRVPGAGTGSMRLLARLESLSGEGTGHRSEPFVLHTGQRLVWRIQQSPATSDLPRVSSISVFGCASAAEC